MYGGYAYWLSLAVRRYLGTSAKLKLRVLSGGYHACHSPTQYSNFFVLKILVTWLCWECQWAVAKVRDSTMYQPWRYKFNLKFYRGLAVAVSTGS